jgi:hypothetical protein
MHDRGI